MDGVTRNMLVGLAIVGLAVVIVLFFGSRMEPVDPEFERQNFEVEMVVLADRAAVSEHWEAHTGKALPDGKEMAGYAYWPEGEPCRIVVPEPRHQTDDQVFAVWGHELAHCLWGQWHPQGDEYEGKHGTEALRQAEQAAEPGWPSEASWQSETARR